MSIAVDIEAVTKTFGAHAAVKDLRLSVPEGSVYGFIGPNGSGKTTTMRMILRIIQPDTGSIRVFGRERGRTDNDDIAYLPEERGLYRKIPVLRQLTYFGTLQGMSPKDARASARRWLERMGLGGWEKAKTEALSKGMTQKVQFISSVMARPRLLVLDEPFSGLDPVNLEQIRETILELKRDGVTILFSTHDMSTAEAMCDSIFMIYRGEKVLDGSLASIQARYGIDAIRLGFENPEAVDLSTIEGVEVVRGTPTYQDVRYASDPQELLRRVMSLGAVRHFELRHPSLHDIFVRIANPAPEEMEKDTAAEAGEVVR